MVSEYVFAKDYSTPSLFPPLHFRTMAATTSSKALVLAWNLRREMPKRQDSRQKAVINGLLTLATTAAYLAYDLASQPTCDALQDYCNIMDQMGLGIEAAEVALAEAVESFDSEASLSAQSKSDGKATPEPSEGTNGNDMNPLELEPDIMPWASDRMIELIAGHVQARLENTLVGRLIHPLTKALISPLTDTLVHPLAGVLSRLLTAGHTGSAGDTPSEQQSLGQPSNPLVDEGVPFKAVKSPTVPQGSSSESSARRATGQFFF